MLCLDCSWMYLSNKLIYLLYDVFTLSSGSTKQYSNLIKSLEFFLNTFGQRNLEQVAVNFNVHQGLFTPHQEEKYNQNKCTVVVRIIDFVTLLLQNFQSEALKVRLFTLCMTRYKFCNQYISVFQYCKFKCNSVHSMKYMARIQSCSSNHFLDVWVYFSS